MEKHIYIVAALQIGLSIFGIMIGIIILIVLSMVGGFVDDENAGFVLRLVGGIVSFFMFLLSIPGIIAGIGLLKKKEWARILTLIISVMNLVNVPVGTAIGAYSIWAMVQEETVAFFKPAINNLPRSDQFPLTPENL